MKYRICEYCGDHLDFGEQCNCRNGVKPIQFENMIVQKLSLSRYGDARRQKQSPLGVNVSQVFGEVKK